MSKTTTLAATRNLRSANNVSEGTSHHVITWGKGENKRHLKDSNSSSSRSKEGRDGFPNETSKERRISIKSNNAAENNRTTSKVKEDTRYQAKVHRDTDIGRAAKTNVSSDGNKISPAIPKQSEKVPLPDYYAKQGLDYRLIRKNCQIRVNGEGSSAKVNGGLGLYLDSYQLPEGYTAEDLPDSQGISSQEAEDPISPAVMIAAQHRKERAKILPMTSDTKCTEILRRIQMGRRCEKDDEPKRCSDLNGANLVTTPQAGCKDPFDNSLNDSDLIMASQQVEQDLGITNECTTTTSKDAIKRDFNGNNKHGTPSFVPLTSTPLPDLIKNATTPVKETPKTARAVSRSRNRSSGQTNHSGIFEKSVFEHSNVIGSTIAVDGDGDATPRKILKFDESPIKSVKNIILENVGDVRFDENEIELRGGDFDDDNEDELFSQMDMPGEMRDPKSSVFESSSDSVNSPPATQLVDDDSNGRANANLDCSEMDSYLDDDALDAIAKLEAIHCTSGSSAGKSAQSNKNGRTDGGVNDKFTKETPRTRARRQGLSRSRVVAN